MDVGGTRLRLRTGGEGPGLLMLHGFGSGVDGWPSDGLEALSRRRSILAIDLPGHGASDPIASQLPTPEWVVSVIVEVARDILGDDPVEWYGYSMGARIALSALRLGASVRSLALESPNPGLDDQDALEARVARDLAWAERFEESADGAALDAWLKQPIFATRQQVDERESRRQRRVRERADSGSLGAWLRGFGTGVMPSTWRTLEAFGGPVRILVGELDSKYVGLADRILEVREDAQVVVVPGVGHAPHIEAPEVWQHWVCGP